MKLIHKALHTRQARAERMGGTEAVLHRQCDIGNTRTGIVGLNNDPTAVSAILDHTDGEGTAVSVHQEVASQFENHNLDPGSIDRIKACRYGEIAPTAHSHIDINLTPD
jgi:hypothetical protein